MKALKVIGKVFAVLFSIVYFVGLTALMSGVFATNLVSGDYYTNILKSVDLDKVKISELGNFFEGLDIEKDVSVQDALVAILKKSGIQEKTAIQIIESEEIRTVAGNFIGDYINYNIGGEAPNIEKKDVELIFENADVIDVLGKKATSEEIDKIYDQLTDLTKEITKNGGVQNGNSKGNYRNNVNY